MNSKLAMNDISNTQLLIRSCVIIFGPSQQCSGFRRLTLPSEESAENLHSLGAALLADGLTASTFLCAERLHQLRTLVVVCQRDLDLFAVE